MGDQPSHCRTAGMVGAKNLSQEGPERHQRREDPVVPTEVDFFDDICEALCRKDLGERETTFVKKLLASRPSSVDMRKNLDVFSMFFSVEPAGRRFAMRVTLALRKTRFRLLVRRYRTGFPPAGFH
jgi:hypothetical protein